MRKQQQIKQKKLRKEERLERLRLDSLKASTSVKRVFHYCLICETETEFERISDSRDRCKHCHIFVKSYGRVYA